MEAGVSRRASAVLGACTLFATSLAEMYLPHRSGEVTDAVMALVIAGVFALMNKEDEAAKSQPGARASYSTRPPRRGVTIIASERGGRDTSRDAVRVPHDAFILVEQQSLSRISHADEAKNQSSLRWPRGIHRLSVPIASAIARWLERSTEKPGFLVTENPSATGASRGCFDAWQPTRNSADQNWQSRPIFAV